MLIFNSTIHNLWGRFLEKFHVSRVVVYVDEEYIKTKISVVLQVSDEPKRVLKEDAGLELNAFKTSILSKGITQ
jgi:hypothetical protein